ncbi:MAG: TetR/AcrR family transcriptional regulator [Candidatus Cloacimonetes bacterium]|nr:TetR/AcrR family transcriptional regulator [Candidatus Cloacimonadota bacterium]
MESKQKILQAALRIFLHKGYDATSISDVVEESHFTKGGIYHHFKNKEQLFIDTINYLFAEFERWELEIYKNSRSLQEIIRNYFLSLGKVDVFLNRIAVTTGIGESNFYLLMLEAFNRFPRIREKHREIHLNHREHLVGIFKKAQQNSLIKPDLDCDTVVFLINALGEGTMIYHILNEKLNLTEMGEKLSDTVWKSISNE